MLTNEDEKFHEMQLCYGDMIALENPEEENSFVFSDGFLKTKLNMKTFDDETTHRSDFSSCVFQIYPQFANTNKLSALALAEDLESPDNKNTGQQKKKRIEEMQEKLTDEYSFNLDTFNKHKNAPITYGKIVQLMHVSSNKFLSVTFIEADKEKENYKISLEEYSSDSTFFKILPSFIYQKESEGKVFVEDIVFIVCAGTYLNKTPYLHCADTKPQVREKKNGPTFFQTNLNNIGFHSSVDPSRQSSNTHAKGPGVDAEEQTKVVKAANKQITEINASLEKVTYWRIHRFCKILEDTQKEFLSYGDVIWLNNFDKRISLLGRYAKKGIMKRPGEELVKETTLESSAMEVLFADTVVNEDTMDNPGNTNGMWVIESKDFTRGGLIEKHEDEYFRIKHFSTGKYLCAEKKEASRLEISLCDELNEKSLFFFSIVQEPEAKGASKQDIRRYVSKDAFVFVKHKKSGCFMGIMETKKERGEVLYKPMMIKQERDEDVLKIARANTNELLETNFLKSCKTLLMKYIGFLAKLQRKTITLHEITAVQGKSENVSKCLKDLELFITNQLFNTSPYVKFGSINQRRQKILREQYYIEMLIQLLLISLNKSDLDRYFYLKENAKDNKDNENRRGTLGAKKKIGMGFKNIVNKMKDGKSGDQQKIQEDRFFLRLNSEKLRISKMIFRLFIYICKDFEENEFYMFDLIPSFNYYVNLLNSLFLLHNRLPKNPLKFEYVTSSIDFLISLVRNNEIIMKRVSKNLASLSPSAIERLSLILEMELSNQEELVKDANLAVIANTLKQKIKKAEMIEQFINQLSEERTATITIFNSNLHLHKESTALENFNSQSGKNDRINYEEEFKHLKNNLIMLFAAIAKKTYRKERNIRLLKFFRTICSHQKRGITSNQEILSKIFKNESYHKAFLVKITIDNDVMKIEDNDGKILFFEEIFLTELRIKRGNKQLFTNPDDDPDDEADNSNIMNKSKFEATFQSIDRAVTGLSGILPVLTKEEEKNPEEFKNEALEQQMDKMISYLNEQITFYSDLCLGRNYIWKIFLEKVFPIQFVFTQIYNKKIFKETRSAFTRLALNLYIDQQPFSPAIYPQLCRVYISNKEKEHDVPSQENLLGELEAIHLNRKVFEGLFHESLAYIRAKSMKIITSLKIYEKRHQLKEEKKEQGGGGILGALLSSPGKAASKADLSPNKDEENFVFKNYLNNMLLLDILQMISKLLGFNLFHMIQQEDNFLTLFPNLINLLEFDFSNPMISLAVYTKREKLFKELVEQEKQKQNFMANGLSGIKSLFSDVVDNVTGLTKEIGGTLLGEATGVKIVKKKGNAYLDRYNEMIFYSNPLMRSCVSQRNKLNKLMGEEETKLIKVEKDLKILIIDVIKQFLTMRHDFLLTNFLAWYQEVARKHKGNLHEETLRNEIKENFTTVIPEILKVGIKAVDFKFQIQEDSNVINKVGGNLKNLVGNITNIISQEEDDTHYSVKKFKIYTQEREIKDLDGLLTGVLEDKLSISKTLYPSLIMMFYSTQDPLLESKFLEIIMQCFHQRLKFAESVKDLELLFDKSDIENYMHLSNSVREMRSICEKSEVWISEWLQQGLMPSELAELRKIVSFLIAGFRPKSVESKLEIEEIDKDKEGEDSEQEFLLISSGRQKITCFLEIHCIMMDFLKDTTHLLDKVLKDERIELRDKVHFLSLYKKIFQFLRYFVKDNSRNQELLHESLSLFLFRMDLDLGQTDLICEIFRNNQMLCEGIKMKILNEFINYIKTIGRREKFLNIFEVLQIVNQEPVFESQAKIINALLGTQMAKTDDSLYHILYVKPDEVDKTAIVFDFESKPLSYYFSQHKENRSYMTQFSETLFGDRPHKYHGKLLKVLSLTNFGSQGFNLSNARLRKQFNLQFLFNTLMQEDTLTRRPGKKDEDDNPKSSARSEPLDNGSPFSKRIHSMKYDRALSKHSLISTKEGYSGIDALKPAVIYYLNRIYCQYPDTIKKEKDQFLGMNVRGFIEKELLRIREAPASELKKDDFREYFFLGVLKFLAHYVKDIVHPAVVIENLDFKDNEALLAMAEILFERLPELGNSLTKPQVECLKAFMEHYYDKENKELDGRLNNALEEDDRKAVKNYSQSNVSLNTEIFEEGLDNVVGWKAFVRMCLKSDVMEKEIEKEKKALCESFIKIHLMFDEDEKKKYNINVEMKDILQKLVNYVEFALTHKEDKETIMFTLDILILTVKFYPKKEEIQNTFDQINALSMVLTVIAEMKHQQVSDDIFDSLLNFLIVMIEGGNQKSQNSAYNYFITIPNSECVFEKFYHIINDQIEAIKAKKQDQEKDDKGEQAPRRSRHSSSENENLKKAILEKTLRIMQMLTEGHFNKMQLLFQEQTNFRNSYDLVSSVIELLYAYHTDMGIHNYHNILRCFETLTELVQGPCQKNQSALIEGKFLEIASTILSSKVPKFKPQAIDKALKSRKTVSGKKIAKTKSKKGNIELAKLKRSGNKALKPNQLKRWMLERIKYKCMILVYSLLEMKKGYDFVKRIIRSLPLEILKTNLCEIYRRYKKKYGAEPKLKKESLKKYDEDPEDKNNKNSESEYELIIETGFYTFFLINEYLEVIKDPELDFEDQVKGDSKDNLLKGSIIGQLGSLGLSIVNAGIDTVSVVGKAVNKNIIRQFLSDDQGDDSEEKEKLRNEMRALELKAIIPEALKFFNLNSGHIEVLRNKNLEKVYFMLPTYCHYLPEETKEEFSEKVDRSSLESKLEEFVKECQSFIRIAKHEEKLAFFFNQNKFLAIFANYVSLWKETAFFMNIVLNIFIIFSYSDYPYNDLKNGFYLDEKNQPVNFTKEMIWEKRMWEPHLMGMDSYSYTETRDIMSDCGIVMIVCACFVVLFFLCKKAPLYIQQSWGDDPKADPEEEDDPTKKKLPFSIRLFIFLKRVTTCTVKFFLNVDVIYYVSYAALAILGVTVHEFFFVFHLTELFLRFPTLKNVIRSVYEPREALFLTFILWLIFVYIFAIWAFTYLRDQYTGDGDLGNSFCTHLLLCWLYTFDFTFKSNGGIGSQLDALQQSYFLSNPDLPKFTWTRFAFDNLFTILIVIIMVTIVAGIIIDTFGLLRDNENAKLKDMQQVCFMCGLQKETFERQVDLKKGFSTHILKEHFQWNYVYFIAFLKDKDPGEYTGIESFINQKLDDSDLGWFPKFRSISLNTVEEEEGNEQERRDFVNNAEKNMEDFKKETMALKENLASMLAKRADVGSPS